MKIGIVLDKELPDTRVENEAQILGNAGFKVVLLSLDYSGNKPKNEHNKSYKMVRISFKQKFVKLLRPFAGTSLDIYSIIWWRIIKKFIEKEQLDILHLNDLYMGVPLLGRNYPFIVDLHENYPEAIISYNWSKRFPLNMILKKTIWKKIERKIFSESEGIIVLSENFKKTLLIQYRESNLIQRLCIYPNVPDTFYLDKLNSQKTIFMRKGSFTLLYFGIVAERRGVFECIKALDRLVAELPQLHLLIVGPIDSTDRKRFYKYLKQFEQNVTYITWLDFKYFASLIKDIDIGVSPIKKNAQHESGLANKIFQYMYFCKPLIVSNCAPQEEIIINHNCGYVYKSGDIEDLANKIKRSYEEKGLHKEMGERGKKAVIEEYNIKVAGKVLIEFYNNLENK